jgi:ATP synthase protein I
VPENPPTPENRPDVHSHEDEGNASRRNAFVTAARYSEIGFVIPAAVFLGYILGRFFDHRLHTQWLYIAGVIFGAIAGFVQMIRMASAASQGKP